MPQHISCINSYEGSCDLIGLFQGNLLHIWMLGLHLGPIYILVFLINCLPPYIHTAPSKCQNCIVGNKKLSCCLRHTLVTRKNLWKETIQGADNGLGAFTVVLGISVPVWLAFHLSLCNVLHDPSTESSQLCWSDSQASYPSFDRKVIFSSHTWWGTSFEVKALLEKCQNWLHSLLNADPPGTLSNCYN